MITYRVVLEKYPRLFDCDYHSHPGQPMGTQRTEVTSEDIYVHECYYHFGCIKCGSDIMMSVDEFGDPSSLAKESTCDICGTTYTLQVQIKIKDTQETPQP